MLFRSLQVRTPNTPHKWVFVLHTQDNRATFEKAIPSPESLGAFFPQNRVFQRKEEPLKFLRVWPHKAKGWHNNTYSSANYWMTVTELTYPPGNIQERLLGVNFILVPHHFGFKCPIFL